jgi:hypothetical protein
MAIDSAITPPTPDQLLAKLVEMEAIIEQQKVVLNALESECEGLKSQCDHFKGAFEGGCSAGTMELNDIRGEVRTV